MCVEAMLRRGVGEGCWESNHVGKENDCWWRQYHVNTLFAIQANTSWWLFTVGQLIWYLFLYSTILLHSCVSNLYSQQETSTLQPPRQHIKVSRPEWYILSMLYSRDIPLWSGFPDVLQSRWKDVGQCSAAVTEIKSHSCGVAKV